MDLCICIQLGCSTRQSPEGEQYAHVCPRCHNGAVTRIKETKCLQICCVDLVPLGSKTIWSCGICQWRASADGPAPPMVQQGAQQQQQYAQPGYAPQQGMMPQQQQGQQQYGQPPYAPQQQQQGGYA